MPTQYMVTDEELTAVANAIRTKGGTHADLEWYSGFVTAIGEISGGGGGGASVYERTTFPDNNIGSDGDYYVWKYGELISSGTQYIDTGINASNVYGFDVHFLPDALKEKYQSYLSGVLDNFTIGAAGYIDRVYLRMRGDEKASKTLSNDIKMSFKNDVLTINGTDTSVSLSGGAIASQSGNVHVFSAPTGSRKSGMRFYHLSLYDSNLDLLADIYPAKDSNNVACLYDAVGDNYLYNSGSGTFTYNADKFVSVYKKENSVWVKIS